MDQSHKQQYWLPGYGLSRHVVLSQIHCFLGPSASVRPFTYQGREGYLIMGRPLTREQIDDLQNMSRKYEHEASLRMTHSLSSGHTDSDSKASNVFIHEMIPVAPRQQERERPREREQRRDWADRRYSPSDRRPRTNRSW